MILPVETSGSAAMRRSITAWRGKRTDLGVSRARNGGAHHCVRFRPIADVRSSLHHPRMRLQDYFFGQPVRLTSRHSPQKVRARVNEAAKSRFWPFHIDAVVGGIWQGRLRLRYVTSPFGYNAKPVLAGEVLVGGSGSILELRYRAPSWIYVFDLAWYGVLGMVTLGMLGLIGERNPDLTSNDLVFAWTIILAMLAAPAALHYFGTRNADEELGYLLDFLVEHIDAKA